MTLTPADELARRDAIEKLPKRLRQLDGILRGKGVDLAELEGADINKVGFYQAMHKNEDGDAVITDLARIEFAPSWETGPAWPLVQPGPPVKMPKRDRPKLAKGKYRKFMALPDMQIGYYWNNGELFPTHDEAALAIVMQQIREFQPDVIVWHGDNADFPELGRFRVTPAFVQTTQATIDRCTELGFEVRDAAPAADNKWLAGNHEERLVNYIIDNARAAFGLKRGREGEGWPVLSMPHLCRFGESGIDFLPGYPANRYFVNDGLQAIHGNKTGPHGTVAAKYLTKTKRSTMFGHIHSHDEANATDEDGWQVWAGSAGCLCRVDGAVPSTNSGQDLEGNPVTVHESWQQGLFLGEFKPEGKAFAREHVAIRHGWSLWRGKEYGTPA